MLLLGFAFGQDLISGLQRCSGIEQNTARLACFDAVTQIHVGGSTGQQAWRADESPQRTTLKPVPLVIDEQPIEVSSSEYRNAVQNFGEQRYRRDLWLFDDYDCTDFPSGVAAQRFFQSNGGPLSDRYGLDRDGDGYACEWDPRQVWREQNNLTQPTQPSSSGPCGPGQRWVSSYTRSDGTRVSGYCRRR